MEKIQTNMAPTPGGHYSQAIKHGDMLYISGQLPIRPENGDKVLGSIEEQTKVVLQNLLAIAEAGGSAKDHVVKVTIYLAEISMWSVVNELYAGFFGEHRPARSIVPVSGLHHGFLIEIDAIAAIV